MENLSLFFLACIVSGVPFLVYRLFHNTIIPRIETLHEMEEVARRTVTVSFLSSFLATAGFVKEFHHVPFEGIDDIFFNPSVLTCSATSVVLALLASAYDYGRIYQKEKIE